MQLSVALVAKEQLQIVPSAQVQLVIHVMQVDLDSPNADLQPLRDFLIIHFERHQAQDLQLARREQIAQLGGWAASQGVIMIDLKDNTERTLKPGEVVELKPGLGFSKKIRWKRGAR